MPWRHESGDLFNENQVRARHPNTSFPAPMPHDLAEFGYVYESPAPSAPPTVDELKIALMRTTTTHRDQLMYGGVVVGGTSIKTDQESLALLTSALAFVGRKPNRIVKVKDATGEHISMRRAQLEAVFDLVGEFSAACWDAEATHFAAIALLVSAEQVQSYDFTVGWPSNTVS